MDGYEFDIWLSKDKVPVLMHDGNCKRTCGVDRHLRDMTMDEIKQSLLQGDGFVKAMWCGEEECEDTVKAETGVGSRCIPLVQENLGDVCVCCGKPAKKMVLWAKAY